LRQREATDRPRSIGIQPDTYAAVKQEMAALKMLLEAGGGLDQLLSRGVDSGVIARRREVAQSDLNALQERLVIGEREFASPQVLGREAPGNESASANFIGDVPQSEAPPCIINLSADGCFLDWYSTIDYHGSGAVYQIASTAFHHNTTTYIKDNGSSIDPPKGTNNFALQPFWTSPYTFSPSDPNCFQADHNITEITSHHISLGITEVGVAEGSQESQDHSQCFRKYLTVTLSQTSVEIGESATVSVGHLPSGGCALSVTSSNSDVVSVTDYGSFWAAMGLDSGSVTITANCPDGTSGAATLTVTKPAETCDDNGGGQAQTACGSQVGSPGGGGSPAEPPGDDCHWARDYIIWSDGSWDWLDDWYIECGAAELRASSATSGSDSHKLRVRLVAKSALGNSRSVTVVRDRDADVAAVIAVDTSRATAADLEQAFLAAQLLASKAAPSSTHVTDGVVVSEATARAKSSNGPASRAAKYLDSLRTASERDSKFVGKGRSLDIEIDLRDVRVNKSM
jgi:hypothetical protein